MLAVSVFRKAMRKGAALARGLRYTGRIRGGGRLLLNRRAHVHMGENAALEVGGSLSVGSYYRGACGWPSMMTLGAGSRVAVEGDFDFYYGADVQVFDGGTLRLGSGFVNSGCKIRCHESIGIGRGCVISHDFTVMDSNAHELDGSRGAAPVSIGDHVWIGSRVTILPGVTVGDGAVIAAGAVVSRDVPAGALVAGVPAMVVRGHVEWRV